ncbi:hypothetical protein [Actinoplanes couchii]|uniref:Uncharacterized protein n=1 Tax=Actinoplanes couchii TaxID=403638 RepID=A0ABQ3XMA3_9ACTN|nr:hypothetical protein [Actinoplanes couchii]MDR6321530.1 hypothetical protein [Actinoplanes couchii]GID59626.1 hypothetical protein Aco03nite_080300 [Actinoplanes couchii]
MVRRIADLDGVDLTGEDLAGEEDLIAAITAVLRGITGTAAPL